MGEHLLSMIGSILGIVGACIPNISPYIRIIIILLTAALVLSIELFKLKRKQDRIIEKLNDITQRHNALSYRFNNQMKKVDHYQEGFNSIEFAILLSQQKPVQEQLILLYDQFLHIKDTLLEEDS